MTSHIVSIFDHVKNSENPIKKRICDFYDNNLRESVEKWEPIILKKLSEWILTSNQQVHSFHSRPYFMVLAVIFQICLIFYNPYINFFEYLLTCASRIAVMILFGIPLEVAHGTPQISIFYFICLFYTQAVGDILSMFYKLFLNDSTAFSLICLHGVNILKNWQDFPYKYQRLVLMFLLVIPLEFCKVYKIWNTSYWRWLMFHQTCSLAGCLTGFLLGYCWIYRPKDQETDTKIELKNLAIIVGSMILFASAAKLSGLHV